MGEIMMQGKDLRPRDLGRPEEQLIQLDHIMPLHSPYDQPGMEPDLQSVKPEWREKYCMSLDGCAAIDTFPRPANEQEEKEWIEKFLKDWKKHFLHPTAGSCSRCSYLLSIARNATPVLTPAISIKLRGTTNYTGLFFALTFSGKSITSILIKAASYIKNLPVPILM
jgi:hypothetical protein